MCVCPDLSRSLLLSLYSIHPLRACVIYRALIVRSGPHIPPPQPSYQHCVTLTTANYHYDGDLGFAVALQKYRYISFNKLHPATTSTAPTPPQPLHSLLFDWRFYRNIIASASRWESRRCTKCSWSVGLKGGRDESSASVSFDHGYWFLQSWVRIRAGFPIKPAATVTADRGKGQGIKRTIIRIHVWRLGIVSSNNICSKLTGYNLLHLSEMYQIFSFLFFEECIQRGYVSYPAFRNSPWLWNLIFCWDNRV